MITADDLTDDVLRAVEIAADEQCKALFNKPSTGGGTDDFVHWYAILCSAQVALGRPPRFGEWDVGRARARIVEHLNARTTK